MREFCNLRHITTGSLSLHQKTMNHSPRVTGRIPVETTIICILMSVPPTPKHMVLVLLKAVLLAPVESGHSSWSINVDLRPYQKVPSQLLVFVGIVGTLP